MESEISGAAWAEWVCSQEGSIFIDTETTGTDKNAEIVDIGIVSITGEILLDTLVKPIKRIPLSATQIHGISNSDVENAPRWPEVYLDVAEIFSEYGPVVIYNSSFDVRLMNQDNKRYGLPPFDYPWQCAMNQYASYAGEWNERRGSFRLHKLGDAVMKFGVELPEDVHRALTDAVLTMKLVKSMAGEEIS